MNNIFRLPRPNAPVILCAGLGLAACCVTLAAIVGDIGFQGDDWWVLSFPFWNSFPHSWLEYARESKRPMEGLYWITMFEMFRFNQSPYFLFSLFLLAGSSVLMGHCLLRAFPTHKKAAVMSMMLAFVLPQIANLTYMLHTDNSRISMVFFWTSVLAFQNWASGRGSWARLIVPVSLYCLSVLTYENTSLLIFLIPLFVLPIHAAKQSARIDFSFLFRLFTGIVAGFVSFLFLRFLVFSGGAVGHATHLPSLNLLWDYISTLALFTAAPFSQLPGDKWAWTWGLFVAVIAVLLLFACHDDSPKAESPVSSSWLQCSWYPMVMGLVFFLLGTMPYLVAGYGATVGYTSHSRIYSSGSFGLAIIIGFLLASGQRSARFRSVLTTVAVLVIWVMAAFFADLKNDWQEAAVKRRCLCASLVKQVPGVMSGTTFLFLDLQSYISNRAVIFQGVDGLGEFVRMLYNDKDLYAYFLYPQDTTDNKKEGKIAEVSESGVMARGSAVRGPSPLDSLLILERQGTQLVLLDRITAQEQRAAIAWHGITEMRSSWERVAPVSGDSKRNREMCRD